MCIRQKDGGIECSGTYQGTTGTLTAPVVGVHHVYNIAAAVMVATHLGFSEEYSRGGKNITNGYSWFSQVYSYGKATIIDDSYNSNPEGFKAALDVLKERSKGKSELSLPEVCLELGDRSEELHEQIGGEIAFVADELLIISKDSLAALRRGVGDKYRTKILFKDNPDDILAYIRSQKDQNVCVLLENRLPASVIKELKNRSDNV